MTIDVLGPASTNAVTTRPASTSSYGATDTWFKPCSSPAAQDGTFITNDWLNLILAQFRDAIVNSGIVQDNGDDMLWRVFEVMSTRQADDTGAVNALVITDTPPIPAFRSGLVLFVKVKVTNTGPSTITWDGETAVPIVNWVDGSALGAGALVASGYALMVGDDAGNMRLINTALSGGGGGGGGSGTGGGLAGAVTGLLGSAPGMTKTASWTVQEISAEATLGGASIKGANLTLNFNGAGTGANGMDTGTTPVSGSLAFYAINNPTTSTWATLACLTSTSNGPVYSGSNMPAGYTYSAKICETLTDGSGYIVAFAQWDKRISILPVEFSVGAGWNGVVPATGITGLSIATAVPPGTRSISGWLQSASASQNAAGIAATASGLGQVVLNFQWSGSNPSNLITAPFKDVPLAVAQTTYPFGDSGTTLNIYVSDYQIEL